MDYTLMIAHFRGNLHVVTYKGIVYDCSGSDLWKLFKVLREDGRIVKVNDEPNDAYATFRFNPSGDKPLHDHAGTYYGAQVYVACQSLCEPFTIEGIRIRNNNEVRALTINNKALGLIYYKDLVFDLDSQDDIVNLGKLMVSYGLIQVDWDPKEPYLSHCKVLIPRFEGLNLLFDLKLRTFLYNVKSFYQQ